MKVAIINERFNGGATRCALDVQEVLSARGHDVRYYPESESATPSIQSVEQWLEAFRPDVVSLHSFYGDLPYKYLADVSRRFTTVFTVHDPRPIGTMEIPCWDCNHSASCLSCPLVSAKRRYSVVGNRYFRERLAKRWTHFRASTSLEFIAPSAWMAARLKKHELGRFTIHHVPYGLDCQLFQPVDNARALAGLPLNVPIILHVARSRGWAMMERKGLRFLADAFVSHVLPEFPSALLVVVGEGAVPNHRSVFPAGPATQEELPTYYSAADIFVAPTLADNLPFTVMEAMACGAPVVGSAVGGVTEQIEEGVTGMLVPKAQVAPLGRAIVGLLNDRPKLKAMGMAGRNRVAELFGMQKFADKYEQIFQHAASRRN